MLLSYVHQDAIYIKAFWPGILSFSVFAAYVVSMGSSPHGTLGSLGLYMPLLMLNLLALPIVGLGQLVYGINQRRKSTEPYYRLHIVSALTVLGVWLLFMLLLSLGFYLTV